MFPRRRWNFTSKLLQKGTGVRIGRNVSLQFWCRRWPKSLRKDNVSAPKHQETHIHAMGTKKYLAPREEYFFLFWDSAFAATKPGPLSEVERCDGA